MDPLTALLLTGAFYGGLTVLSLWGLNRQARLARTPAGLQRVSEGYLIEVRSQSLAGTRVSARRRWAARVATPTAWTVDDDEVWCFVPPELLEESIKRAGELALITDGHAIALDAAGFTREGDNYAGEVGGCRVVVEPHDTAVRFVMDLGRTWTARPGKGTSGNIVLDHLLDTSEVPESSAPAVLDLVHGAGGLIEDGLVTLTTGETKRGLRLLRALTED